MATAKREKEMREYNEFLSEHVVMTISSNREEITILDKGELKFRGNSEATAKSVWDSLTYQDK